MGALMALYQIGRREGDFERCIEKALLAMLVSPNFLFRVERDPAGLGPGTSYYLGDVELASRLSFFLWSSIPDEELLSLAERGELSDPTVLGALGRHAQGYAVRLAIVPATLATASDPSDARRINAVALPIGSAAPYTSPGTRSRVPAAATETGRMFIRFVTFESVPDKLEELKDFYSAQVVPGLQQTEGCLFASLVESTANPNEFSSLTLWESSNHIQAYEEEGRYAAFVQAAQPFLAGSDQWELQLSEDLTLEYKPVIEERQADAYRLCAVMDEAALRGNRSENMHLRLLNLQTKDGGFEGLKQAYVETIIPALRGVKGCRNAFLMANVKTQNKLVSVTVWDSQEDAEAYDRSEVFQSLMRNTRDLLSAHMWQSTLKSFVPSKVYTNEDVKARFYSVVAGRSFPAD